MSYVVLARKWRPMKFRDLVGQDHVCRTLENAIKTGRVAHAFLFTGVRGVGKTTSARILAKALCCMRPAGTVAAGEDPGPTLDPCLECPACLEIGAGTDVDVREIDGASYNGVDEVRKLQEQLPYRPSRDRYKIYIVDEVHMLSTQAWNAFLKTLEEPPPHVKFIFATTEVHKVPITILSRVQRFDFKLISTAAIAAQIRHILSEERLAADDGAITIIAREAAGSMRDALSLLDQVIAWGGDQLTGVEVARVLGVASHQVLHDIARALVDGDAEHALGVLSALAQQGYDMAHVARDLLALLRDLVVAKVCREPAGLLDLADVEKKDVIELAASRDADDLLRLHQGFSAGFDDVVRAGQPRAALEMLLVRLARRPPLVPLDELVGRLGSLERRLAAGGGASRGVVGNGGVVDRQRPRAREARPSPLPRAESTEEPPAASVRPSAAPAAPTSPAPRPHAASEPTPEPEPPLDPALCWARILDEIGATQLELAVVLEHASLLELDRSQLVLGYAPGAVLGKQASQKEALTALERAAANVLGQSVHVVIELESSRANEQDTRAAELERARRARLRQELADARSHPAVISAVEILGARIKELKLGSR